MSEFQPTEEFFKEEIKGYDSDIVAAGKEAEMKHLLLVSEEKSQKKRKTREKM